MGVKNARLIGWILLPAFLAGTAYANPKLRLSNAAIGPLSIAVGANGPQQFVEAFNVGDGTLNLAITASAAWLAPAVGVPAACTTREGVCLPITIGLQTAGLPQGVRTGTVTVSDPNAFDAPQTITVTIQMGGGVPNRADLFVAPNGATEELAFETNSELQTDVTTQTGGTWLSLTLQGSGSFRFVFPYRIRVRHPAGLAEGTYNGSVNVTGSGFPPDIKNVPVTMRVTSQPIAVVAPERLATRVAQDSVHPELYVGVGNRGLGALNVTGAQATAGGGDWLSAEKLEGSNIVKATINTSNLAPGMHEGTVAIASNAVNGPLEVPVSVEVVPQSPPIAAFEGVVNNATFERGDAIGQGGIAAVFGEQLSYAGPQTGTELPLVTELGSAKVYVNGVAAPLYYTSYSQINLQIPYETPAGEALVTIMRDGQAGNVATLQVASRAPRLLRLNIGDYGIIVNPDGSFPVSTATAALWGINGRPARPGEALVIYAIGLGQTSPPVASGAPAPLDPLARIVPAPAVYFGAGLLGGVPAAPLFVGLTPNFVGLYQINVIVPGNAPKGDNIPLRIEGDGVVSNRVEIAIE